MSEADDGFVATELVVRGYCEMKGGKLAIRLHPSQGGLPDTAEDLFYPKSKFPSFEPGSIIEMPMKAREAQVAKARYLGRVKGYEDTLLKWQAESDATILRSRTEKALKDARGRVMQQNLDALYPLREAYQKTDRWGRTILEALVLQYMRNPL